MNECCPLGKKLYSQNPRSCKACPDDANLCRVLDPTASPVRSGIFVGSHLTIVFGVLCPGHTLCGGVGV